MISPEAGRGVNIILKPFLAVLALVSLVTIMLLIVPVNVLLGTFMDAIPAILIFVPIVHPLAVEVGIHPVHLGVAVVMTQAFGLLTPWGCAP